MFRRRSIPDSVVGTLPPPPLEAAAAAVVVVVVVVLGSCVLILNPGGGCNVGASHVISALLTKSPGTFPP